MKQKNIVLLMVDQLRFDCLGINGNDVISTPYINELFAKGCQFTRTYSAVPSCIAARASLMTGLHQGHTGRVGYEGDVPWTYPKMMGDVMGACGYQTKCIGKLHVTPERKRCGFDHVVLHDGYLHEARKTARSFASQFAQSDDYLVWLKERVGAQADLIDLGLNCNSWVSRPWALEEQYHPTNWVVTQGIDFLRTKDPTMPFFLKLSFTRPHAPLDPPPYYFDMYWQQIDRLPLPKIGDWEQQFAVPTHLVDAKHGTLPLAEIQRASAGYYGAITHIDHQIGRFMMALEEHDLLEDTIIVFLSDHGDQLGEHHLFRKAYPYQGSIHVPFAIYDGVHRGVVCEDLVALQDVLPTLVELATGERSEAFDGRSVLGLLGKEGTPIRQYVHGEHELGALSTQFIVTKDWKYIWYPHTGVEQLFYLTDDPHEQHNRAEQAADQQQLQQMRQWLVASLCDREEGFVVAGQLRSGVATAPTLSFLKS